MPSSQETFQGWLDQGYIPYRGWSPQQQWQYDLASEYGLTDGGPFARGNPFYEGAGARDTRWDVSSKQDILDYLEFANKMGTHTGESLRLLGVPEYDSTDIWEFFERPGELSALNAIKDSTRRQLAQGNRAIASEGARVGRSAYAGSPALQAQTTKAGLDIGRGDAEATLAGAVKNMARQIERGDRDPLSKQLLSASELGIGRNRATPEALTQLGGALIGGGATLMGSGSPQGAIAGLLTAGTGAPIKIGAEDQIRRYNDRLATVTGRLGPQAKMAAWSERLPDVQARRRSKLTPWGGAENALRGLYASEDEGGGFLFGA